MRGKRRVLARRGWAGEKSDFFSILLDASLEFIPPAQAASEHECAVAGGDDDEAVLVVQPRDVFVDAERL